MKQVHATLLGMLASTVLPAGYIAIAFPLSGEHDLLSIVGTFIVAYFYVVLSAVVLGIPMFWAFSKLKLIKWWSSVVSGGLVGCIAIIAVRASMSIELVTFYKFAMLGGISGFVFWLFWRAGRS